MRLVLFDLGDTLEHNGVLLPGAKETLEQIAELGDGGRTARLGLVSDFEEPDGPAQIPALQRKYYAILERLGIRFLFEPVAARVTLSTEVGVSKPDPAIFRAAMRKAHRMLSPADVLFVTENLQHVHAARDMGMRAIHFRGPGQTSGDVADLLDLLPLVREFILEHDQPAGPTRSHQDKVADSSPTAGPALGQEVLVRQVTPESAVAAVAAGERWVRVGNQLLVTVPAGTTGGAPAGEPDGTATRAVRPPGGGSQSAPVLADRLHLVTQDGRLFQREHPDVRVIVDKGRYLVVDLDPAVARGLSTSQGPCYAVEPIPLDSVVLDDRPRPAAVRNAVPWVQTLVDGVSGTDFRTDLEQLVAFGTRYSTSATFVAAAERARDQLVAHGYSAALHPISVRGGTSHNVIAERAGTAAEPRDVIVVTAHLDSINIDGGPIAPAPGADDNGSGSAGALAIARALAGHVGELDLRLILFGGEEEGLLGSLQYVAGLGAKDRGRIRAVINMDMIGTLNAPIPTVLLEGATLSQHVIDGLADAANTYTTLAVQTSLHPFNSDHVPFIDAGVPAVLTIEGADSANERVHSENDRIEFVDRDLPLEIIRMNVAFIAQVVGRGDVGRPS